MRGILDVRNLSFSYGKTEALDEVSMSACEGQLLFVLGENGSGKSTLLKVLAGILAPRRGTVKYRGRDLFSLSRRELSRSIVYGGTQVRVDFPITVRDYVSLGRFPHRGLFGGLTREDTEIIERSLDELGIAGLSERDVTELSDGEKQKVLLAKMRAQDVDVYLFDEPGAHLDVRSRLEVFDMVAALSGEGKTVIVTSHDIHMTGRYADHLIVLKEGRVYARGKAPRVLTPETIRGAFGVDAFVHIDEKTGRPMIVVGK